MVWRPGVVTKTEYATECGPQLNMPVGTGGNGAAYTEQEFTHSLKHGIYYMTTEAALYNALK